MLTLLSPAKTLDFSPTTIAEHTQPRLLEYSAELIGVMKEKSVEDIQSLMGVSEKLAQLNYKRFQAFSLPFSHDNAKQAILAFKGDVYTGLQAEDFSEADLKFSQQNIHVISGLYGILRPLDLIQAYRLEMGTKLQVKEHSNLYKYWGNTLTELINQDLKNHQEKAIINLASNEYFKSINKDKLEGELYNIHFKEERNGKLKIISFSAKKARGMMCRFVIKNRIEKPEDLKSFSEDNYLFRDDLSSVNEYIFTK